MPPVEPLALVLPIGAFVHVLILLRQYIPLQLVGMYRWSVWLTRRTAAALYRVPSEAPTPSTSVPPVSIVVPVYNEDPDHFEAAIRSWAMNEPYEVIAVLDPGDLLCRHVFEKWVALNPDRFRLILFDETAKRPKLARGIPAARGELVALVDSDTVWDPHVLRECAAPFADPTIGGVGPRQRVIHTETLWQRVAAFYMDTRYDIDLPAAAFFGRVLTCLSGRTAFYRRAQLLSVLDAMLHETFWGRQCISGEDKRLTYLVQAQGYSTMYQARACAYTFAAPDRQTFFRQRLRWTRNSWRADLRALTQQWAWRHPYLVFTIIDRFISSFTVLMGPAFCIVAAVRGDWFLVVTLLVWWHVSRLLKVFPHIRRNPRDIAVLPVYILTTFVMAGLKIYALLTIAQQGWLTRTAERRPSLRSRLAHWRSGLAVLGTVSIVSGTTLGIGWLTSRAPIAQLDAVTIAQASRATGPQLAIARGVFGRSLHYDRLRHRLVITATSKALSVRDLALSLNHANFLRETKPAVWVLTGPIVLERGAKLRIGSPDTAWLRLAGIPAQPAAITIMDGAALLVDHARVSSWDSAQHQVIHRADQPRAYLLALPGGTLTLRTAVIDHLGYAAPGGSGVSWVGPGTHGGSEAGQFIGNYYGLFASGMQGGTFANNLVAKSIAYGLYFGSGTSHLTIRGNRSSQNGSAGIVLAGSSASSVVHNYSQSNHGAGIALMENALNNRLFANTVDHDHIGIVLDQSSQNTAASNTASYNTIGIRIGPGSVATLVQATTVQHSTRIGIYIYAHADGTQLLHDRVTGSRLQGIRAVHSDGLQIRDTAVTGGGADGIQLVGDANTGVQGNTVAANAGNGLTITQSTGIQVLRNHLTANGQAGLQSDAHPGAVRVPPGNVILGNRGGQVMARVVATPTPRYHH